MADIEKIFYFDDSYNDYSQSQGTQYRGTRLDVYYNYYISQNGWGQTNSKSVYFEITSQEKKNELNKLLNYYVRKPAQLSFDVSNANSNATFQIGSGREYASAETGNKRLDVFPVSSYRLSIDMNGYPPLVASAIINSHTNANPPCLITRFEKPKITAQGQYVGFLLLAKTYKFYVETYTNALQIPPILNCTGRLYTKDGSFSQELEYEMFFRDKKYVTTYFNIDLSKMTLPPEQTFYMEYHKTFIDGLSVAADYQIGDTLDRTPNLPINLSPNNASIDYQKINRFSWIHDIYTGTPQYKFDLEYSKDGESWTILASPTTDNQYYDVPIGNLSVGKIKWRVRTYSTNRTPSPWATADILVKGKPPKPIGLTTTYTQIPTLSWQAKNQAGYRILINGNGVVYDSNEIFGTEKQYKIPFFLEQGKRYELSVAIANNQGYWSEYTTTFINVQNNPMPTIKSVCVRNINHVKFMWEHNSSYRKYLIYRDGIFLDQTKSNQYEDWLAFKNHAYKVIAVGYNYFVKESEIVYKNCMMNFTNIHEIGKHKFIDVSKNIGSNLTVSSALESNIAYHSFDGRQYPVAVSDGVVAKTHTLSVGFFNTEKENISNFENLVGKLVCFKSVKQYALIGVLTINSKTQEQKYTQYEYTITEVTMSKEFDIND